MLLDRGQICGRLNSMKNSPPCELPFDIWHHDGHLFDVTPDLFVDLTASPIIFSVRGIGYFSPRFKHAGVEISNLHSKAQFESALNRWLDIEFVLLQEKIAVRANASKSPNEHQVLQAVLDGDIDLAEKIVARLEHRKRTGMKLVGGN